MNAVFLTHFTQYYTLHVNSFIRKFHDFFFLTLSSIPLCRCTRLKKSVVCSGTFWLLLDSGYYE